MRAKRKGKMQNMKLHTKREKKRQCEVNQIIHTTNKANICRSEKRKSETGMKT